MSQKTINWIVGIVIVIVLAIIGNFMQKCDKGETAKQEKVTQTQEKVIQNQETNTKYASWNQGSTNKLSFMIPPNFEIIENTSNSEYDFTTISGGTDNSEVLKIQYTKNIIGEAIPYETAASLVLLDIVNDFKSKGFDVDFKNAKASTYGTNTFIKWDSNFDYCNVYFGRINNDVISVIAITNNSSLVRDFLETMKVK